MTRFHKRNRKDTESPWTADEHNLLIEGLKKYGKDYRSVS